MLELVEGEKTLFEKTTKEEMDKVIKHYEKDLSTIRTGRASTSIVETVKADVYGQLMPIRELATISAPDARLITIQPWDKGNIGPIEKAIQKSDIGIAPINDGTVIRLQLPLMSSDRRDELVKHLGKKSEEARVGVRNVRRDYHNIIRDAEKSKILSEDFSKQLSVLLQKITDSFIDRINVLQGKKETDLKLV